MLMRSDPFRDLDELTRRIVAGNELGRQPMQLPIDAYRHGHEFVIHADVPGIEIDDIDITVEKNALTINAERGSSVRDVEGAEIVANERRAGTYSRQLFLGDSLDVDRISAACDKGVLTLRIPIAESAKPRKISVEQRGPGPMTIETEESSR